MTSRFIHEAYMFVISARDMARLGLLFLRSGNWNGKQVISAQWVEEITTYFSDAAIYLCDGYEYMWWLAKDYNKYPHFPMLSLRMALTPPGVTAAFNDIIWYSEWNIWVHTFRRDKIALILITLSSHICLPRGRDNNLNCGFIVE